MIFPLFLKSGNSELVLIAAALRARRAEEKFLSLESSFLLLTQKKRSKRKGSLAGAAPRSQLGG